LTEETSAGSPEIRLEICSKMADALSPAGKPEDGGEGFAGLVGLGVEVEVELGAV